MYSILNGKMQTLKINFYDNFILQFINRKSKWTENPNNEKTITINFDDTENLRKQGGRCVKYNNKIKHWSSGYFSATRKNKIHKNNSENKLQQDNFLIVPCKFSFLSFILFILLRFGGGFEEGNFRLIQNFIHIK